MLTGCFSCFDTLFSRSPLRPGETISSYMIYLCTENGVTSTDGASLLFFPSQSRRVIKLFKDYPPLTLHYLARLTRASEAHLLKATFHHIGLKFGRSTHPQALSRFLNDAVSPYLRVCPPCMATNPYHRLTWRFVDVLGCLEHHCHLIDSCQKCRRKLPLFRAPFKLGRCPYCEADLSQAKSSKMNSEERHQTEAALEDIEFLLTPSDWEDSADKVIKSVGLYLMTQRANLRKAREDFAHHIGISETMLAGIELARFSSYGATFQAYKAYANSVGITLKAAFLGGIALDTPLETPVKLTGQTLVESARSAIDKLSRDNSPVTGKAVAELVRVPRSTLILNEEIATMIARGEAERLRKIEENLAVRAAKFLQDLYTGGETCSQEALADHLGISRAKLRRTEQLISLLRSQH